MQRLSRNAVLRRQEDRRLVRVRRIAARIAERVGSLVADVSDRKGHSRSKRLLKTEVPRIERRQKKRVGSGSRINRVTRIRQQSAGRHRDRRRRWRSSGQSERSAQWTTCCYDLLAGEDWKILRRSMPKDRTEDADVKAASITTANDCLRIYLVGDADAWAVGVVVPAPVHIAGNLAHTRDIQIAGVHIKQGALPCRIDRLGEVELVAQTIVHGQLRRNSPGVLRIEEVAFLELLRVR